MISAAKVGTALDTPFVRRSTIAALLLAVFVFLLVASLVARSIANEMTQLKQQVAVAETQRSEAIVKANELEERSVALAAREAASKYVLEQIAPAIFENEREIASSCGQLRGSERQNCEKLVSDLSDLGAKVQISQLFDQAAKDISENDYEGAAKLYETVIHKTNGDTSARLAYASALLSLGNQQRQTDSVDRIETLSTLERAAFNAELITDNDAKNTRAWYIQAKAYCLQGAFDKSQATLIAGDAATEGKLSDLAKADPELSRICGDTSL